MTKEQKRTQDGQNPACQAVVHQGALCSTSMVGARVTTIGHASRMELDMATYWPQSLCLLIGRFPRHSTQAHKPQGPSNTAAMYVHTAQCAPYPCDGVVLSRSSLVCSTCVHCTQAHCACVLTYAHTRASTYKYRTAVAKSKGGAGWLIGCSGARDGAVGG
ncbi:hypothetical protein BC567DRAFT_217397, partial [Phyllosticta citribraziliensis]